MKKISLKSIFGKMALTYIITLITFFIGAAFFRIMTLSSPNTYISAAHLQNYAELLTERIGNPPVMSKLEEVLLETALNISISGPDFKWESEDEEEHSVLLDPENSILTWLFFNPEYHIETERGPYHYVFSDFHADYRISIYSGILLIMIILAAIAGNFLMVRRLFRPLQKMYQVALEFGVHDWKHRVNPKGRDELAVLGREMDSMADRIESYIESIHSMLSAVSHEFRSPLTRMKVSIEFVKDKKIRDSLNEEIDTLDRMTARLLEQKRLVTQTGALNITKVRLFRWIKSFIDSYARKGVVIRHSMKGEDCYASIDRDRMELAMSNLVENVLKHGEGSPAFLEIDTEPPQTFAIRIYDHGPGMPEELIEKAGEAFLKASPSPAGNKTYGGFGLGLSIVKAVADAHGGGFHAENIESGGLSVTLTFSKKKLS